MDSKMTTFDQSNNNNKSNINQAEQHPHKRTARSVSHGRTYSASGARSKIPMNINHSRPPLSITNAQINSCTQDDSASSITPGNATRRLTRSHNSSLSKTKVQCIAPGGMQIRWLESQFKKEKKRYLAMKKELDEKQKIAQQIYHDITQLRDKLISDGGKDPGGIEEITIVSKNGAKQSGDQNSGPVNGESPFIINDMINQEFISKIGSKLQNYPNDCVSLCEDAIKQHSEVLNWIKTLEASDEKLSKAMSQHVHTSEENAEMLGRRLENERKLADEFNTTIMHNVMMMWAEIETSRWRIKHLESMSDDTVNELHSKFNTEVEKFNQLEEMKMMVDNELMKSKSKVQALEMYVDANEAKIVQLQSLIKNLECQLRQNDINFEHTTRDFHKSLKHSEETIVCLETQRDDLLSRLNEMQRHLEEGKKDDAEKSQKIEPLAKYRTEDNMESDGDAKKKVVELETLVEALRDEIASNKNLIVKLQKDESRASKLTEQLEEEQLQLTRLQENYEQLRKEHESLQQKFATRNSQFVSSYHNNYDSENIEKNFCTSGSIQSTETLREDLFESERRNKDLETQLQQQSKNLEMKNRMIEYLKGEKLDKTTFNTSQVGKENDSEEILQELYSTLETKQMQLTHLENVLKQMENQEMRNQEQRTRYEKRIAQLEFDAQMRKRKDFRYVKDFSVSHSSSKQSEVVEALELERKYQRLKRESWQMENFYDKLMESTTKSVKSRDPIRDTRGSKQIKEYTCRLPEEVRHVNVGCYAHQIVEQCGRELSGRVNTAHRQKDRCGKRVPHRMIGQKLLSKREFVGRVNQ